MAEKPPAPMGAVPRWECAFFTTKHSWKGKYKRLFAFARTCCATLNPTTFEITNRWDYKDEFLGILPSNKAPNEFVVTTKKKDGKKTNTLTFSCEFRLELLSKAQMFRPLFCGEVHKPYEAFTAVKFHWSETRRPTKLSPRPSGLVQVDHNDKVIAFYQYKDIEAICLISDVPGGFTIFYGGTGRMHMFALDKRDQLLSRVSDCASRYLGLSLKVRSKTVTAKQFRANRLGKFSGDLAITSLAEFEVHKISNRHPDPVPRVFALSETCIVERDPMTYTVVAIRALSDVYSIVRDRKDPQKLLIQYFNEDIRVYLSTDRDTLLATILDSVRAAGNRSVSIQYQLSPAGERYQPLRLPPDEDVESALLKYLGNRKDESISFPVAVARFNTNIDYGGLQHAVTEEGWFKENKEKLILNGLRTLLEKADKTASMSDLVNEFGAIRRLVASKAGFAAFTQLPGFKEMIGGKVVAAIQTHDDGVIFSAVDMLCTLMQPMHDDYDLGQEKANKDALLASRPFLVKLLALLQENADARTGALVVSGLLDFFTFSLCAPYSETTESAQFEMLLRLVADLGRSLFALFEHTSMAIVKAAGLIMKALIEEGDAEMCAKMQMLSLAEGSLLRHFHTALFTKSVDNRMLTHRQLSRHLIGLWMEGNKDAEKLFKGMLPAGLVDALKSDQQVNSDVDRINVRDTNNTQASLEGQAKKKGMTPKKLDSLITHWRSKSGLKKSQKAKPVVLRRRKQLVQIQANWDYFYNEFNKDHSRADLIWNYKTREELREAIDMEMRAFLADKDLRGQYVISWNFVEFEVRYESLAEEVKIGDHYLRLLLEKDDLENQKVHNPLEFFNDLYHRFLLTTVPSMKAMCLQAMAVVYKKCHEEIGSFNDTEYIVTMLNRCENCHERDRLLQFLNTLLLNQRNVKRFIDANGIRCLVDLVTLAHLHTSRATVPLQSNVIEASQGQLQDDYKEWYYGQTKSDVKSRKGPVGLNKLKELYADGVINAETRVWAQGMDGWRPLRQIPQLKWTMVATGQGVLDLSELSGLCLSMLIRICSYYPSRDADGAVIRPLPRAKRMLTDAACLPHIVQLLLTFDPFIVEKTSTLLNMIMEDNSLMPRLYLTGCFFFIMMYTGSNVLPIANFLKKTHMYQSFRSEEETSRSILAPILPEAMVCFLNNYGPDKFASIFLGEFDTPETIWGNEMRRNMIEKIALHISDFSPRLQSNTRALYQYCPIPKILYKELENELFCNIYYLRHLCDLSRFGDWEIKNHIELLKDILDAWKKEVEKKPSNMSLDDAYETLGLESAPNGTPIEQSKVRKAYFKMSMKYHPDKNPEGRDMFEKISKAYEYLSERNERTVDGPNPENLVLILKAQSILYRRFPEVLAPYKYAGYPMLMVTIQRETEDSSLFSSSVELLRAAAELCYYTVKCSPLNAEELRREGGIETLAQSLSRCVSVIGGQTTDDAPPVLVCVHILNTYSAASKFEECRERITEVPQIIKDLCRCLWIQGAASLTKSAIDCVTQFAVESYLQNHLQMSGAIWHLVGLLFGYDYTLDESGVEAEEDTNAQLFTNNNAKLGVTALRRLGGYMRKGRDMTPENPLVQKTLNALLTPFLAKKLSDPSPLEVLKLLNCNSENPYLIWDNATRAELTDYVEKQQEQIIRTGEQDPDLGAEFVFSAHRDELILAGVYVRIYNEQPSFPLMNSREFTIALLDYLGSEAQYLFSEQKLRSDTVSGSPEAGGEEQTDEEKEKANANASEKRLERLERLSLAIESLRNVLKSSDDVKPLCKGHFRLVFSLLRYDSLPRMQELALEVISLVIGNRECVTDIAKSKVLVYMLMALKLIPTGQQTVLESLHAMVSDNKIIQECMNKGATVYFLDMYCNSQTPVIRETAAQLLAKLLGDKLHGPRIRILISKFLPQIFMDAMRDNAEASVSMFEGTHENPELIWNDDARAKVQRVVGEMVNTLFEKQHADPEFDFKLPEDFEVVYENIDGELIVGGVVLRLLIKNPNWSFRKPKQFLVAILSKFVSLVGKSNHDQNSYRDLGTVTEALTELLNAQTELCNHVPQLGFLSKILLPMQTENVEVQSATLRVFNGVCTNTQCVRVLAKNEITVKSVKAAMAGCSSDSLVPACEMLKRMYEQPNVTSLVRQALDVKFIPFLLDILHEKLDIVEFGNAGKAHLVKALKAMSADLTLGEEVDQVLNQCPWWKNYKDQRHDLFITNSSVAGYLTGGSATSQTAGYLMAAPVTAAGQSEPPPMADTPAKPKRRGIAGDPDS